MPDVNEIVARLIENVNNPGAYEAFTQQMKNLPPDVQREVWGRLTDNTPNPTGDR